MADSARLEAIGISVERGGRQLFSDLDFVLLPGEIVHLQGENGAGKSSLLRVLAGLSKFGFEGTLHRTDTPLYLGHASAVKSDLSPRENLRWHPSGELFDNADAVDEALREVGLLGYEDVPSRNLSAGQQRRIDLARLYLSSRALWLLDEPFTAIDVSGVEKLLAHMASHIAKGGSILLTSHQSLAGVDELKILDLGAT